VGRMDTLRKETPLAECSYGWGQVFRLYHDRLEVNGVSYPLNKLAHVRPVYQRVMGIDSVRLELRFGGKRLILRGIAAIGDARRAITYLNSVYLGLGNDLSDDEACGGGIHDARSDNRQAQSIAPPHCSSSSEFDMTPLPSTASYQSPQRIITAKVAAASWERFRRDQRERRERRIHIERMLREFGFDVEQLEQRLKEEALPEIAVPLRLLPGERAHYSADAALCDEPVSGPACSTYPARDHGLLILTNKRLLFLGRKSQVVLDYARLTDVVRLRGAVALEAKHWYKREIFEVQRPLECVMYLECLHERWQQSAALRPQFRTISSDFFDDQAHSEHLPVINIDTLPLAQQIWETNETSHHEDEPM
jgi:hypothetical protein